jgi:hypothetical protein
MLSIWISVNDSSPKAIRIHVFQQSHPLAEQSKRLNHHYSAVIKMKA